MVAYTKKPSIQEEVEARDLLMNANPVWDMQ